MAPTEENTSQRRRRRVRFGKHRNEEEREPLAAIPESTLENSEYNDLFDFKGVKYLARTWSAPNKDNALIWFLLVCLCGCLVLGYFCLFHFHTFHYHLSRGYAHLGHVHAQHIVGERLLHGSGVQRDEEEAMRWFRKAADQGHPHASYNLAVGHLTGIKTDVEPGEIHTLIKHAHENGVDEASDVLHNACRNGHCDD